MRCSALCLALVVAVSAAPLVAYAGEPTSLDTEARHHFEEGTKLFNLGEFAGAIGEYKAGYKARPDPVFLYNIAQAYRQSNDLAQSVFFYRSYLRNAPNAPNRREVEDRVRKLEAQLASSRAAASAPPNSPVAPFNRPSTTASEPPPQPSAPTPMEATPPPAPTPTPAPAAASAPTPAPAAESNALVTTAPPPAKHDSIAKKWWLWTAVGVVVVGAGVGVGLGLALGGHQSAPPSSQYGSTPVF